MSEWGRRVYGQPCRECGFSWDVDLDDAKMIVAEVTDRLAQLLAGATGDERHPDLAWPVRSYVSHIADNLRIWAERMAGVALGGSSIVASYDENALARARAYYAIDLKGALWTLRRSSRDWLEAVALAPDDLTLAHPERGTVGLGDIVRGNAHDAAHHVWDIRRCLYGRD